MWRKLSWTISIGKQLPASMSLRVHTLLWNRVTVAICPFFITCRVRDPQVGLRAYHLGNKRKRTKTSKTDRIFKGQAANLGN